MLTWDGRLRLLKRWQDIPVPDGRDYYDGYDPNNRASVDPKDLEVRDDEGNEIPIYDEDGFRVPRRGPILAAHQPSWGVLADLTLIRSLFDDEIIALDNEDSEDDDMESIEEVAPSTRVDVYPQAGLRKLGHFKATDVPKGFKPILKKLNRQWAENRQMSTPIIRGISCQGYNHAQHCLSDRAGGIEVLHGQLTAAMAGMQGDAQSKWIREGLIRKTIPFECVTFKLQKKDISRGFRVESVFSLNVQGLK